jgi:hypothetical protein
VPGRIISRMTENFAHMMKFLFSTRQISIDTIREEDIYGFKKTLVALSKQGKVFGMSSFDGALQWTSNFMEGTQKIFIRKTLKREDEFVESQIVAVTSDSISFMNNKGALLFT